MNLFSPKERDAVEDKFYDTPVYAMARDVCYKCFKKCETFALHPSELLYLAFYLIDTIRGSERCVTQRFVNNCYDDHLQYLRHDKKTGASTYDLQVSIAVTLHTAVQWILESGSIGWQWVVYSLEEQIVTQCEPVVPDMAHSFQLCVMDDDKREQFMVDYMLGSTLISQQIDDLLESINESEVALNNRPIIALGDSVQTKTVETQIGSVAENAIGVLRILEKKTGSN